MGNGGNNLGASGFNDDKITSFASSDVFEKLFSDGMDLVEETAAYLDGEGRKQSKLLERAAALIYASESMRLTTRLMQAASWLLVQRAVREGEMSAEDARDPKYRIGAKAICTGTGTAHAELPEKLNSLLERSQNLYLRIDRLDSAMFEATDGVTENPINAQLERLQAAFGA